MKNIVFIEPIELYNLLNQVSHGIPCVTNEYYLVLLDTRKLEEYSESHVVLSRHVSYSSKDGYVFPKNIDFSAVKNLVVIDNRAASVRDFTSPGVLCAELLCKLGSKNPVRVVKGGYEDFSALYPFLSTIKILWTQREIGALKIYPIEVEPGFLYIGVYDQACCELVSKHLKLKAHVNVTTHQDPRYTADDVVCGRNREKTLQLLHVCVEDDVDVDISAYFNSICSFIDRHDKRDGKAVLIYSDLGVSRCVTVALCYLIFKYRMTLKEAVEMLRNCHQSICPNRRFVEALLEWEGVMLGETITKPADLGFLSYD